MKLNINSLSDLDNFTKQLQVIVQKNNILLLEGPLAAGKTTLVKKLLHHFNYNNVVSPSFNVMNQYLLSNDLLINHFDFYRLMDQNKFLSSEFEMYFEEFDGRFTIIEWPNAVIDFLSKLNFFALTKIEIKITSDISREIIITTKNKKLLENLKIHK